MLWQICGSSLRVGDAAGEIPAIQAPFESTNNSIGRVLAFQAGCCRFDPDLVLHDFGELDERFKSAVLKTVGDASPPGVRIPRSPPVSLDD